MKPFAPQCILFDLDGTLINTADDLGYALNEVLVKYNRPIIAANDYTPVASDGSYGLLNLGFGEDINDFNLEDLRREFLDIYEQQNNRHASLFDGVETLLTAIDNLNIPWGIITNKPYYLTPPLLAKFTIFDSAKVVLGGDSLDQKKPHPLPMFEACKTLCVPPVKSWYVGDAERDMTAANRAGMFSILANYGFIPEGTNIELWQADWQIENPTDLLAFLKP